MTNVVEIHNDGGKGKVVLLCEHASNEIPDEYAGLGLTSDAQNSHAAWDLGARELTMLLSERLDAIAVMSKVSRLIYDCNRPPEAPSAMPERSELIAVPGNMGLSQVERDARTRAVYVPFCKAVSNVLDAHGPEALVVTIHSFTPVYFGEFRTVELRLLHDNDSRLVDLMLEGADALPHRRVERNQPYGPEDGVTHTLVAHALGRELPNVMLEVRNDLLGSGNEIAAIAQEILVLLEPAIKELALKESETSAWK